MIKVKNVFKAYDDKVIYNDFSVEFEDNKITAVLGESGSGKTTLLNMIANLTRYTGEIEGEYTPTSFIFQKDRLVKNLTVEENLKLICPDIDVSLSLKEVGLSGAEKLYPKNLSAGMARRVAILRGFLYPSKTLLMDEPFINLDIALKYSLLKTVKDMQEKSPKTVVFVTHDIGEAIAIADKILVLDKGEIIHEVKKANEKTEKELFGLMMSIGDTTK